MMKYLALPDGRPRHFSGTFATIVHRGREIRAHLDALADRSMFVSNVFADIGTCELIAVPDAIDPTGIDGFVCLVYHDDPPVGALLPTMDCCAFFDATPGVWKDLDAWAARHVVVDDVCAAFADYKDAVTRHNFAVVMPKLWQKIHRIRQPTPDPPEPKYPDAYRKLATFVLPMPLVNYSVTALVLERRRRRSQGRFIPPSPRLKDNLIGAILHDDMRLFLGAMGADATVETRVDAIATLRKIYGDAERAAHKNSPYAKYGMTYHGHVIRGIGRPRSQQHEIAPPVLPTTASITSILRFIMGVDGDRFTNYGYATSIRFMSVEDALMVRDDLAALFWDMPPRLDQFV